MRKYLMMVVVSLLLVSCATVVSDSNYPVTITSQPTGAKFKVKNAQTEKVVIEGRTPNTVFLEAGFGYMNKAVYKVEISKKGYQPQTKYIIGEIDNWYLWGNLFSSGVVGWLIVDPATGAMWELPPYINAKLSK